MNFFYFTRVFHFLHFGYILFHFMIKEKDFSQLKFSPFKKMDKCRQLTNLISCPSSILTGALLLLQLQAVIALKSAKQQNHLPTKAIMSRNNAWARYQSARIRFKLFTVKKVLQDCNIFSK